MTMPVQDSNMRSLNYRPDIDGMRAIAVLGVIAFHVRPDLVTGGFLGVDIFFVISGYLISLILARDIAGTGRLHLLEFYKRRIKRIFPALLFILAGTLLAGFMVLTPDDLARLCTSASWSLFSAANIYFYSSIDTGYFAPDSREIPLLNLWSLGVEEQFYFLWPFFMLLVLRLIKRKRWIMVMVGFVFLSSLVLAQVSCVRCQSFAYYMLPTRVWELMAGGICALLVHHEIRIPRRFAEVMGLVGLGMVMLSMFMVSRSDHIPGVGALPAVMGACMLILSSVSSVTAAGKVLSTRALVAVGLISYSLYLWHWPLLSFLHYVFGEVTWKAGAAACMLAFVMATVSYFLVEQPFRRRNLSTGRVFVLYFFIPLSLALTLCYGLVYAINHKLPGLYDWEKYKGLEAEMLPAYMYSYNCQYDIFDPAAFGQDRCVYPQHTRPTVLLAGDSNAAHYLGMLMVFADHFGFSMRNATQDSCPLLLDGPVPWVCAEYRKGCNIYLSSLRKEIWKYDTVIIGGSWNDLDVSGPKGEFRRRFASTVRDLAGRVRHVIILGKVPVFPNYNKDCGKRVIRAGWLGLDCREHVRNNLPDHAVNQFMRELAAGLDNVDYFDIRELLCHQGYCSPYVDNMPVYYNTDHLSIEGSRLVGQAMIKSNFPSLKIFEKLAQ